MTCIMYIKAYEDTNIHIDNMFSLLILIMLLHYVDLLHRKARKDNVEQPVLYYCSIGWNLCSVSLQKVYGVLRQKLLNLGFRKETLTSYADRVLFLFFFLSYKKNIRVCHSF